MSLTTRCSITLQVLASTKKQERNKTYIHQERRKKLSLFTGGMTVQMKNPKESATTEKKKKSWK
jgi:hypothetical protein